MYKFYDKFLKRFENCSNGTKSKQLATDLGQLGQSLSAKETLS